MKLEETSHNPISTRFGVISLFIFSACQSISLKVLKKSIDT